MHAGQGRPRAGTDCASYGTGLTENPVGPPLAAFLFDVCGVLYDDAVWRRWLFRLVTKMGIDTHFDAFFALFDRDYLAVVGQSDADYWQALRRYLRDIGLGPGTIDEVVAAGRPRRRDWEATIRLLPGVRDTLGRLATRGVPLGVVCTSAIPGRSLARRIRQLGLESLFEGTSEACGNGGRTHPETLVQHAQRLHVTPDKVGFVSCSVLARQHCQAAGLRVIAIAPATVELDCIQIDHFSGLVALSRESDRHRLAG